MNRVHRERPYRLWIGLTILGLLIGMSVFAPFLSGYDVAEQDSSVRLLAPSFAHVLGTDRFGRDIFTRVLFGGRTTLASAAGTMSVVFIIGTLMGTFMGLYQDTMFDIVWMRIIDALMAFPFMVFAMVVTAFLGPGIVNLLFAIAGVWWVPFARVSRSMVINLRGTTSLEASYVLGAGVPTIVFREILPRIISPLLVQATFELGCLILSMSALSFLGLGAQPPVPEWGSMMSDGRAHFIQAPYVVLGPALFVILTVLSLNLVGESLRDRLDPYERMAF